MNYAKFAILVYAGLKGIAKKELVRLGATILKHDRLSNYDIIYFNLPQNKVKTLNSLKIAEDLLYIIERDIVLNNKKDLNKISLAISREAIFKGINFKNKVFPGKNIKSVNIFSFVKQDKDRYIKRKQISYSIIERTINLFPKWKVKEPANLELWGFYINKKLTIALRLSDKSFRYRGSKPPQREGALRPTIAAALVYEINPINRELIIDPMCGTGTILKEVRLKNPNIKLIGGDIDNQAVHIAKERLSNLDIEIYNWDATELPFQKGKVDGIVCNLPFGKKFSTEHENKNLYPKLLSEWITKLKPSGRIVLLTSDDKSLIHSMKGLSLKWENLYKVKVLGEWATCYKIRLN
jgi:SAM-dependent methyltransferase